MALSWLRKLMSRSGRKATGERVKARPRQARLRLEELEARLTPASMTLGDLQFVTNDSSFTNLSVVQVGIAGENFVPSLQLSGVQFNADNQHFTASGEVDGFAGGQPVPLLANLGGTSSYQFDADSLTGGGLSLTSLLGGQSATGQAEPVSVAGVDFVLSNLQVTGSGVELQGNITLPELAGLSVAVSGNDHVVLDSTGVYLSGLDASLASASFTTAGLTFAAQNLQVQYSAASDTTPESFGISGDATVTVAGDPINLAFGTSAQPGIVIDHLSGSGQAQLQSLDATVTTPALTIGGLALDSSSLELNYVAANSTAGTPEQFAITGNTSFNLDGNSVSVQLGDSTLGTQGLVIENGALTSLDMAVTGDVKVGGLDLLSKSLEVSYTAGVNGSPDTYTISGEAGFSLDGNTVSVQLGDSTLHTKGIVIQGGALVSFDAAVTSNITIAALQIQTDSLRVTYAAASAANGNIETITVSGSAGFTIDGNMVNVQLGAAGTQGIVIQDGRRLSGFDAAVTSKLSPSPRLRVETVLPPTRHLRRRQRLPTAARRNCPRSAGSAGFTIDGNMVNVQLGAPGTQGIVIQDGALVSFDASVSADFNLFGLAIGVKDLTVVYSPSPEMFETVR